MLKDYNFNKQTIAEALVKVGEEGIRVLLKVLNDVTEQDFKLKSSILKGLAFIDIKSPYLDFVIETLYKCAQ